MLDVVVAIVVLLALIGVLMALSIPVLYALKLLMYSSALVVGMLIAIVIVVPTWAWRTVSRAVFR